MTGLFLLVEASDRLHRASAGAVLCTAVPRPSGQWSRGHLLEAPREEGAAGKRTRSLAHESRPKTPSPFAAELAEAGAQAGAQAGGPGLGHATPCAIGQVLFPRSRRPSIQVQGQADDGDTGVRFPEWSIFTPRVSIGHLPMAPK